MATILRQPDAGGSVTTSTTPDLIKSDFGSKVAVAALTGHQTPDTKTQTVRAKSDLSQQSQRIGKQSKSEKTTRTKSPHPQGKNLVEERELETRQIIGLSGGNVAGGQLKSNKQLIAKTAGDKPGSEVEDAWSDPNKVKEEDDILTALKKLSSRTELQQATEPIDEKPLLDLHQIEGLNGVARVVREFGNFGYLERNPELVILMTGGYSETVDNLLQAKGIEVPDPTQLTNSELQFIFGLLQAKKKKVLTEEEEEAELILAGAVTVLAIPEILKKLQELGIDPRIVQSLNGELARLIAKAGQEDSKFHSLYLLVKEEAELSILPPEEDALNAAA